MSTITGASIYTGTWIDWSRGAVVGSTITLSARSASVLTAFLALFVTIVGSSLWRLLSFSFHQCSASPEANDGLHHQYQLTLRNTTSPFEATKAFTQIAWYWRGHGRRACFRSLPVALFALVFLLAFGAASILVSLVTQAAGAQRLIVSNDCGYLFFDPAASLEQRTLAMQYKDLNDTLVAAEYARQCYDGDGGLNKLRCSIYTKQSINWTSADAACPFDPTVCSVSRAFKMDSGLIDSHADLGINSRPSDRISFRKVTTCSPLSVEGDYVSVVNSTGEDGLGVAGDRIRKYHYGAYLDAAIDFNTTYLYNQHAFIDGFGYEFNTIQGSLGSELWLPIPELARDDADITLMFLAPNAIKYNYPTKDPFFGANILVDLGSYQGVSLSYYTADHFVSVMACADQYQYCNGANSTQCTPLTGWAQAWEALNSTELEFNEFQAGVATRIAQNSRGLSTFYSIGGRGAQALRAQETIYDRNQQAALPDNQWQLELQSWFAVSLARLQHSIVEYAAPSIPKEQLMAGTYLQAPFDKASNTMCSAQKVSLVGDTVSFSTLGLAIILAVGGVIILLYLVLQPLVSCCQRRTNRGQYRRLRWVMDDKMQVQRMAFEEAGMGGTWTNLTGSVPVTQSKDALFGDLHHVDFAAPRLGKQWTDKHQTEDNIQPTVEDGRATALMEAAGYDVSKYHSHVYQEPVYHALSPLQEHSRESLTEGSPHVR